MTKSTMQSVVVFALLFNFVAIAAQQYEWTAYVSTETPVNSCDLLVTGNYQYISLATDSQGRAWQTNGRGCEESVPSFLRYFDRVNRNWTVAWTDADSAGPEKRRDSVLWFDKNDNLYMYGGYSKKCDFWKFSPLSKTWTNLTVGDCSLNSVQKGVEDSANYPGPRRGSGYWYTPDDNSLWLFSGWDDSYYSPKLPDLWRFNITSGKWAFIAGLLEPITTDDPVFNDAFEVTPIQRWGAASAVDADNNLWLYGGGNPVLNDHWMFNRSAGWQYISGNQSFSSYSFCTEVLTTLPRGVFSSQHRPVCSSYASMTIVNKDTLALWTSFTLSDQPRLWLYNITSQEWAYFINSSFEAVANVLYVPDSSTTPGQTSVMRANAPHSLWIVADNSAGVFVLDFDQCVNSPCSEYATCTQSIVQIGPICTCNEGYEGDGITCTALPVSAPVTTPINSNTPLATPITSDTPVTSNAPVTTPVKTNSPKSAFSSASRLSSAPPLGFPFALSLFAFCVWFTTRN